MAEAEPTLSTTYDAASCTCFNAVSKVHYNAYYSPNSNSEYSLDSFGVQLIVLDELTLPSEYCSAPQESSLYF